MSYPIRQLKEVCTINPRRPSIHRKPDEETSFIQMSSVEEIGGTVSNVETRRYEEVVTGYTYFEDNDVIFAKITPCMQNGKCAIVAGLKEGFGFGSTEFHVVRAGPEIIPEWIHAFLRQPSFRHRARAAMTGAVGQQRVPTEFLAETLIPLPDLPTQRRIAARLKDKFAEIDAARTAAEAARADGNKMLDHFLREAFQHVVPLSTNPLNPVTPKGWQWAPLMKLARLESGHTPSRRHPEYWENGDIPWLALPDIRALDCQVAEETKEKITDLGLANSSARMCPADTVAMCRTASVGYVTILGKPMATTQHFTNWICGDTLLPRFLMWLIRASRKFTQSIASGSILPDIYMNVVHNFHVCLPPLETQRKIVAKFDAAQAEIKKLYASQADQLDALNKLPAAYLREAFGQTPA